MNTQMILNELSLIFQEILKRDNIVLASEMRRAMIRKAMW